MGYEREVLIRARNRHKEAVEQYRKEQQQRLLEIYMRFLNWNGWTTSFARPWRR